MQRLLEEVLRGLMETSEEFSGAWPNGLYGGWFLSSVMYMYHLFWVLVG